MSVLAGIRWPRTPYASCYDTEREGCCRVRYLGTTYRIGRSSTRAPWFAAAVVLLYSWRANALLRMCDVLCAPALFVLLCGHVLHPVESTWGQALSGHISHEYFAVRDGRYFLNTGEVVDTSSNILLCKCDNGVAIVAEADFNGSTAWKHGPLYSDLFVLDRGRITTTGFPNSHDYHFAQCGDSVTIAFRYFDPKEYAVSLSYVRHSLRVTSHVLVAGPRYIDE